MSGPTGWGSRRSYRPDSGIELASDDTAFDVVNWRQGQTSAFSDVNTELDNIEASLTSIESDVEANTTELQAINTELDLQTTALGSANSQLVAINTELDTQTASLASASSTLASLNGKTTKSSPALISEGKVFMCHHNNSSLGIGSTINVYLKTPTTTPLVHMMVNGIGSGAHDIEVLEAPTVTPNTGTNGTSVFNRYRDSATTSGVFDNATTPAVNKVSLDVTVTADGTIIRKDVIGDGKTGGDYSSAREIILKANTAYVFRLTSQSAGNRVHINLDWYED